MDVMMSEKNTETLVVILPTYNEAGTIAMMLDKLFGVSVPIDLQVLVYDSNSTDNTADIVKAKHTLYPKRLHLLQEPQKTGLGSAYFQAMRYALQVLQADFILECDADGSHPVKVIAHMLNQCGKRQVAVCKNHGAQSYEVSNQRRAIVVRPIQMLTPAPAIVAVVC